MMSGFDSWRYLAVAVLMSPLCFTGCDKKGTSTDSAGTEDEQALRTEAKALVGSFAEALKGELTRAMTEGGPALAIDVCSEKAPAIAASLDAKPGWSLRRTSLKVRNPDNVPDAWEREVLELFETKRGEGQDPASLEKSAFVGEGDGRTYRFVKAIPTAPLCLTCHGKELAPEVEAALDARYPKDEARGFVAGDIRGAFSVQKAL